MTKQYRHMRVSKEAYWKIRHWQVIKRFNSLDEALDDILDELTS